MNCGDWESRSWSSALTAIASRFSSLWRIAAPSRPSSSATDRLRLRAGCSRLDSAAGSAKWLSSPCNRPSLCGQPLRRQLDFEAGGEYAFTADRRELGSRLPDERQVGAEDVQRHRQRPSQAPALTFEAFPVTAVIQPQCH